MGIMDKVKFWRHEPKIDLDSSLGTGFPEPSSGQNPGFDQMRTPMQAPTPSFDMNYEPRQEPVQAPNNSFDKNIEIVSMKLDNLKASLENINQRLINIERIAIDSQRQEKTRKW